MAIGALPIRLKMWAEDRKIIPPASFAGLDKKSKNPMTAEDRKLLEDTRDRLHQEGFGKGKPGKNPGRKAPPAGSWMKHVATVRAATPGLSYKMALQAASKTYSR
jgi:hypothetical protein